MGSIKFKNIKLESKPKNNFEIFTRSIKRTFGLDIFKGLALTIKEFFKPHVVVLYPMEKIPFSPRYRAIHKLQRFAKSNYERCIGCGLCEKICTSNCISMTTDIDENSRKNISHYTINFGRCIYCGLCAEVCPELAIVHGEEIENASYARAHFGDKSVLLDASAPLSEYQGVGSTLKPNELKATPLEYNIKEAESKIDSQIKE